MGRLLRLLKRRSGTSALPTDPPVNIAAPAIGGIAQQGQTLSASAGAWGNSPTSFSYQWRRGGADISGATSSAYTLVPADVGAVITVRVFATNIIGSTAATSAGTDPVLPDGSEVPPGALFWDDESALLWDDDTYLLWS